ncbi:MAG: serine/threonine protein kinase [Ideonella sp.]|nr:serine/threonine protein kinase [Ideonella sp.]
MALKLPRLAWGAGLAERMAREREIGALLEHSHIARMYDAGVDERGRPFLAMEYIDGQPIDAWCEAQGLDVPARLRLFVQVIRAVAYAHGRLVVHRDLKPSNVLVTPDGQAHLLDFGIAKLLGDVAANEPGLTQQQGRVMTPHYASPEQVAGEAITVQSDVYSLGVLLYELLTGLLPIEPKRGTLGAVEEAILQGDAPLASGRVKAKATARALRGEVDAILAMAMRREPAARTRRPTPGAGHRTATQGRGRDGAAGQPGLPHAQGLATALGNCGRGHRHTGCGAHRQRRGGGAGPEGDAIR